MFGKISVALLALATAANASPVARGGWGAQTTTTVVDSASTTTVPSSSTTSSVAGVSASSAATTGTSSSGNTSGGGGPKINKGVTFKTGPQAKAISGASWGYSWSSSAPEGFDTTSFPWIPMLWGAAAKSTDKTSVWQANAQKYLDSASAGDEKYMLAFNEPDRPEQADMSVTKAVAAWNDYMEQFANQAALGAPAVTSQDSAGMSLDGWLLPFLEQCKKPDGTKCSISFVPIHWYGPPDQWDAFQKYVQNVNDKTGLDVWVTEFGVYHDPPAPGQEAPEPTAEEQVSFLQNTLPFLEGAKYVKRYAYFGTTTTMLTEVAADLTNVVAELAS